MPSSRTGCFPTNRGACQLSVWKDDGNESSVTNSRDFKLLKLVSGMGRLYATISFYSAPVFDESFSTRILMVIRALKCW